MVAAVFISGLLALAGVTSFADSVSDVRSKVTGRCVVADGSQLKWADGDLFASDIRVVGVQTSANLDQRCGDELMDAGASAYVVAIGAEFNGAYAGASTPVGSANAIETATVLAYTAVGNSRDASLLNTRSRRRTSTSSRHIFIRKS